MNKTDWKRHDSRIESYQILIDGIENSILQLRDKLEKIEWYDGLWFLEESEPIYGLAFVALQNYINSSIYDRFDNSEKKIVKYKLGEQIDQHLRTDIELIIGLANYFKHREDNGKLHKGTQNILNDLDFRYDKEVDIVDSPIFKGLDLLTNKWELNDLLERTSSWREKLWTEK
ncbi:hypothetical protein [Tenacibaculum dicentrarchi]